MKIVSVDQMRALEAAALAAGASESSLQERAGAAVADAVREAVAPGQTAAVLAGYGNNGRDGAVAARRLAERGLAVVLLLGPRHALTAEEIAALTRLGVSVGRLDDPQALEAALRSAAIAVDALVGIGARGPLREPLAAAARLLNRVSHERGTDLQVLALDIPSGIDPDTGQVPGDAVWADRTIVLGGVKQGLLRLPAAERVGILLPREIGIPSAASEPLLYEVLDALSAAPLVPDRPLAAHKYRFGRVLVVAGSDHFLGAPTLCAAAAARTGAGLVTVASSAAVRQAVAAHLPEATFTVRDVDPDEDPDAALAALEPVLDLHPTLVLGPGLGRSERVVRFVRGLLELRAARRHAGGLVVDADALFALAGWPRWWERLGADVVLTPHAGELARLAGDPDPRLAPWEHAARLAATWHCVLVSKGAFTCVAAPDGRAAVWPRANPALASGGTGDVLAGLLGGLLAQSSPAWDAARLAVAVHAGAARSIVEERRWRTLLASDLLASIPRELARLSGPAGARPPRGLS